MTHVEPQLRSQRLRMVSHQGDALRLGMNWTEEDLAKPQVPPMGADVERGELPRQDLEIARRGAP